MLAVAELEVYQAGELTVLGFGGHPIADQLNVAEYYDQLMDLVRDHNCQTLAIDLTGVRWIPSGLLGVLMSMHRLNIDVHLYNPSLDIREVLEITKLDRCWHIHEIDL